MAFTHTKKVDIGSFIKARIRIRIWSQKSGSVSATLILGIIHQCFGYGCTFSWFLNPDPHPE
jgi:hypothetical protein